MNPRVIAPIAVIAVLVAGYLGAARHAGQVIEQEVSQWQQTLAAMDEVFVHDLRYQKGWFGGSLHVDLSWRPLPGQPAHDILRELLGPDADLAWRIEDVLPVQHGPWAGGAAWARAQAGLHLPSILRERLPQYPGTTPWLSMKLHVDWARRTHIAFEGVPYQGRYVDPHTKENGRITLQGLHGRMTVDAQQRQLTMGAALGELSVADDAAGATQVWLKGASARADLRRPSRGQPWTGPMDAAWEGMRVADEDVQIHLDRMSLRLRAQAAPVSAWGPGAVPDGMSTGPQRVSGEMTLSNLQARTRAADAEQFSTGAWQAEMDITQAWPFVWTGRLDLRLQDLAARSPGGAVSVARVSLASETKRQDDMVNQTVTMEWVDMQAGAARLPALVAQWSVRDVQGAAMSDVLRLVDGAWANPQALLAPHTMDPLAQAAQRILRGGPSVALDRLSLQVEQADDIVLSMRAGLPPNAALQWDQPDTWLPAVQARLSLTARSAALKTLSLVALQMERTGEVGSAPVQALQDEAEQRHATLMQALAEQPYLDVTPERVRTELQWAGGGLRINGREVNANESLAALAGLGALAGSVVPSAVSESSPAVRQAVELNTTSTALFGTLRLSANFDPDPRKVELVAGGDDVLGGELGAECIGRVNAAQSDVDLTYDAGDYALFIYADSYVGDIALIIRAPDGSWHCSDDSPGRGLNPLVQFKDPASGTYKIWVATLAADSAQASVFVSEVQP